MWKLFYKNLNLGISFLIGFYILFTHHHTNFINSFFLNCNSKSNSGTENHVAKEPDYLYTEHNLIQFLFKRNDSIEVNIQPVILNDEALEYTTTDIYLGSEDILRIRGMLKQWQKMKEKYKNNEITKEALEDWKANFPDSLKKDYVPFEESNLKRFNNGMSVKVPLEIK